MVTLPVCVTFSKAVTWYSLISLACHRFRFSAQSEELVTCQICQYLTSYLPIIISHLKRVECVRVSRYHVLTGGFSTAADGFRLTHTTHSKTKIRLKTEANTPFLGSPWPTATIQKPARLPLLYIKTDKHTRRRGCRARFYTQAFWKISPSSECGGFYWHRDPVLDAILLALIRTLPMDIMTCARKTYIFGKRIKAKPPYASIGIYRTKYGRDNSCKDYLYGYYSGERQEKLKERTLDALSQNEPHQGDSRRVFSSLSFLFFQRSPVRHRARRLGQREQVWKGCSCLVLSSSSTR
jgi:hypothetical protein